MKLRLHETFCVASDVVVFSSTSKASKNDEVEIDKKTTKSKSTKNDAENRDEKSTTSKETKNDSKKPKKGGRRNRQKNDNAEIDEKTKASQATKETTENDVRSDERNDDVESGEKKRRRKRRKTTTSKATKNDDVAFLVVIFRRFRRHRIFVDFDDVVFCPFRRKLFFDFGVITFIAFEVVFYALVFFVAFVLCHKWLFFVAPFFLCTGLPRPAPAPVSRPELPTSVPPSAPTFLKSAPNFAPIREVCPDEISSRLATFCRLVDWLSKGVGQDLVPPAVNVVPPAAKSVVMSQDNKQHVWKISFFPWTGNSITSPCC